MYREKLLGVLVLFLCCCIVTRCHSGVDVSRLIDKTTLECFSKEKYEFVIPRCFHSYGKVDLNCSSTIKSAYRAGYDPKLVFAFPCAKCGNVTKQVDSLLQYLKSESLQIPRVFLDIEGYEVGFWFTDHEKNKQVLEALCEEFKKQGQEIGIYAGRREWGLIFGDYDYPGGSKYTDVVWYAHYEKVANPSFSDWVPYGGWTKPTIKQFRGTSTICNFHGPDRNWTPYDLSKL